MKFRTEINLSRSGFSIDHQSRVLMLGSCFSGNIGQKLEKAKIPTRNASHGILFNPHSINQALLDIIGKVRYGLDELDSWDGKHFSFNHHGIKSEDPETVLNLINEGIIEDFNFLQDADVIFITLGTAWAYQHQTAGLVANCHKVPNGHFEKVKLGVSDIVSQFSRTFEHLFLLNPSVRVVFTVSPVRHWKDGAIENQWSKSTLNVAIHELVRRFDKVSYFPSYELIMDDLRDYRFFKEDLLHPNDMAINYVWEKFQDVYFSARTRDGADLIEKWFAGFNHKVMGDEVARTRHISGLLERADELEADFGIDLAAEKADLSRTLNELLKA